jgi:hypothetical protein
MASLNLSFSASNARKSGHASVHANRASGRPIQQSADDAPLIQRKDDRCALVRSALMQLPNHEE